MIVLARAANVLLQLAGLAVLVRLARRSDDLFAAAYCWSLAGVFVVLVLWAAWKLVTPSGGGTDE